MANIALTLEIDEKKLHNVLSEAWPFVRETHLLFLAGSWAVNVTRLKLTSSCNRLCSEG